jgi:uncharacterized membrane protein
LIASLSINVLLASYAVTLSWRLDLPLVDLTSPTRILPRAAALLDPEDRETAERVFGERQADLAHTEAGVQAARARVIELLQAPELDPAAVRAALYDVRTWRSRSFDLVVDTVLETVETIPADRRRALMQKFQAR